MSIGDAAGKSFRWILASGSSSESGTAVPAISSLSEAIGPQAENHAGSQSIRTDLHIDGNVNITVNVFQQVIIRCSYESNPSTLTKVKWYHNGKMIDILDSRYEGGSVDQPSLKIKSTTKTDIGTETKTDTQRRRRRQRQRHRDRCRDGGKDRYRYGDKDRDRNRD